LAGPHGSGKTTLAASLYEGFLSGEFPVAAFVGSRTLVGWEERCHLARVASGGEVPDTGRTSREDLGLLHLDLNFQTRFTRLLFADLSGEHFEDLMEGVENPHAQALLDRADHVALCIDGARLRNIADRHRTIHEIRVLQRVMAEQKLVPAFTRGVHIITKWDLVKSAGVDAEQFARINAAELATISTDLGIPSKVALASARSTHEEVPTRLGIAELLLGWAAAPASWGIPHKVDPIERPTRPFDWYGLHG
jgi:hypothetical protein